MDHKRELPVERQFKNTQTFKMPADMKQRIFNNLIAAEVQPERNFRLRSATRTVGTVVAACAAVVVFGAIVLNLPHMKLSKPNAANQTSKYNYKQFLGFQPVVPKNVPSGYVLRETWIEKYKGTLFTAIYFNKSTNNQIMLSESRSNLNYDPAQDHWSTDRLNGISFEWLELYSGVYHLRYSKNGINYFVVTGNGLTTNYDYYVAASQLLTSLGVPYTQKPNVMYLPGPRGNPIPTKVK